MNYGNTAHAGQETQHLHRPGDLDLDDDDTKAKGAFYHHSHKEEENEEDDDDSRLQKKRKGTEDGSSLGGEDFPRGTKSEPPTSEQGVVRSDSGKESSQSRKVGRGKDQWTRRKYRTVGSSKPILVGVAARDKKANSKPMQEILSRLSAYGHFEIIIFGDECILHKPAEEWPIVDCLICFYSTGFPLEKAEAYVKLRRPFCVNDISAERMLRDRRKFYDLLKQHNIPTPRQLVLSMDGDTPPDVREGEGKPTRLFLIGSLCPQLFAIDIADYVEINGEKMLKPFVEKPVNAEDHNIFIYYPRSMGGGSKRLFRKVKNKSSEFYPDINAIRGGKDGRSYIYEEFVMTQGTDIKIYIVGPDYAHAEARKSPVVDGIVERDSEGKEVRFPIMLTHEEKEVARKVCLAFRQNVCGFDLLRTHERSYVCDVNGWSFVKKSHKYYDDTAQLLCLMMLRAVAPAKLRTRGRSSARPISVSSKRSRNREEDASPSSPQSGSVKSRSERQQRRPEELRCVAAVIRHGDRTPKQKLKMTVSNRLFLRLFRVFAKNPREEIKLKTAQQLRLVLDITRRLVDASSNRESDSEAETENIEKLRQVKAVLEKGGHFSGINRKVQIKPTKWVNNRYMAARENSESHSDNHDDTTFPDSQVCPPTRRTNTDDSSVTVHRDALEIRIPPNAEELSLESFERREWDEDIVEATLVLKWGGVLTEKGREQSEALGRMFRSSMYPGDSLGLLRLHSTYRHDLKIYSSDEGRVQMTAAAFAKGFLDLEGELTPILASLVKFDNTGQMLDHCESARKAMGEMKSKLKDAITRDGGYDRPSRSHMVKPDTREGTECSSRNSTSSNQSQSQETKRMERSFKPPSAVRLTLPKMAIDKKQWLLDQIPYDLIQGVAPTEDVSLLRALSYIGDDPEQRLRELYKLIDNLTNQLAEKLEKEKQRSHADTVFGRAKALLSTATMEEGDTRGGVALRSESQLYGNETLWLMHDRWFKLKKGLFHPKKKSWDLSKIPDIYDCVKYDTLHNRHIGLDGMEDIYFLTRSFADIIIPQEYGITSSDKREISADICHHLLRKLFFDMTAVSASHVNVVYRKQTDEDYRMDDNEFVAREDEVSYSPEVLSEPSAEHGVENKDEVLNASQLTVEDDQPSLRTKAHPQSEYGNEPSGSNSPCSHASAVSDGVSQVNQESSLKSEPMLPHLPRRALVRRNSSPALGISLSTFDIQRVQFSISEERNLNEAPNRAQTQAHSAEGEDISGPVLERLRSMSATSENEGGKNTQKKFSGTLNALGSNDSVIAVPTNKKKDDEVDSSNVNSSAASVKQEPEVSFAENTRDTLDDACQENCGVSVADTGDQEDCENYDGNEYTEVETWDMTDLRENVHQLDSRVAEDGGYGSVRTPSRHVRTRLYFTSESHVTSLINVLRYWADVIAEEYNVEHSLISSDALEMLSATPELDYLSHIVFRLYENLNYPPDHPKRHRLEILFSPGAAFNPFDSRPRTPRSPENVPKNQYWSPSLCAVPLRLHVRLPVFEEVLTAAIRRYGSDPLENDVTDNGEKK